MEADPAGDSGPVESFPYQIFQFVVVFQGVDMASFGKPKSPADGGGDGKGPGA